MTSSLLLRIATFDTTQLHFSFNGRTMEARQGESVLAAILRQDDRLRRHETNGEPRAGFCLMGACQDCWVWVGMGRRARACTTPVSEGMQVSNDPPKADAGLD